MGGLFSSFGSQVDVSDVFVDFSATDVQLQGDEKEMFDSVSELLTEGKSILDQLDAYTDCGLSIRRALTNPTPDNEKEAFGAVKANVDVINGFYQFSKKIEKLFPSMLRVLATDDEKASIQQKQGVSKKVADVLDFVLKFDELKMLRPGLQNDFSFYRRSLGKHAGDPDLVVRDDEASFISLFIAQPIPMMTSTAKATLELINENAHNGTHVPKVLATIANVCLHLVKTKRFKDSATDLLCVRSMVGSIVLFDHVSQEGAFVKRSGINIRQAVQLITKEYVEQKPLINALRYSTLHFSDDTTPAAITQMLENA
jgi:hypothetical protein